MVQMMREMRPTVSSAEGGASVNVDDIAYNGEVPMSPGQCTKTGAHQCWDMAGVPC